MIISNGHPNEEKLAFPGDRAISVTMLKTVGDCGGVGGESNELQWWNGSSWVGSNSMRTGRYYGYAYVTWSWGGAVGNHWWRIAWGDCVKVFKTGSPSGIPCERNSTAKFLVRDANSGTGLAGASVIIEDVGKQIGRYSASTGSDGRAQFSPICEGVWNYTVSLALYQVLADSVFVRGTTETTISLVPSTTGPPPPVLDAVIAKLNEEETLFHAPTKARVDEIKRDTEEIKTGLGEIKNTESTILDKVSSLIPGKLGDILSAISALSGNMQGGLGGIAAALAGIDRLLKDFKFPDLDALVVQPLKAAMPDLTGLHTKLDKLLTFDPGAVIVEPVLTRIDTWFSNRLDIDPALPFWDEFEKKIIALAVRSIEGILDAVIPEPPPPEGKK